MYRLLLAGSSTLALLLAACAGGSARPAAAPAAQAPAAESPAITREVSVRIGHTSAPTSLVRAGCSGLCRAGGHSQRRKA